MGTELFNHLLTAVLYFFLNPLFLVSLAVALLVGYFRVKKERASFRVRMLPGITELQRILSASWVHAIILSILFSGIGLIVDIGWLVLVSAISIVFLLTMNFKLLSPIFISMLSIIGLYLVQYFRPNFEFRGWEVGGLDFLGPLLITVPIIAGLLLMTEGLLIYHDGGREPSSYLMKTKRGLNTGVFKVKKLWLLPTVFLVPGDVISAYLPYWPQFTLGESMFSFVPVPLIIGFSQVFRSNFPQAVTVQIGRAIIFTGVVVTAVGVAAIWMPILGWTALIAGFASRIGISAMTSVRERKGQFVLAPKSKGLVIAGVLPDSPGEKMGLLAGEIIRSVNGQQVHNEKELYDAIQLNAAHCRLQVVDREGEVRLMQSVLYHHDHHRLGILAVQ